MPAINGSFHLGVYQDRVEAAASALRRNRVLERIRKKDASLWKGDAGEITRRLGWLDSPQSSLSEIARIRAFADDVRAEGFRHILLLGMGGSSLAPEVFRNIFGTVEGSPDLSVLDSTAPGTILSREQQLDLNRTLVVVSTKSGTTEETLALFRYFFGQKAGTMGVDGAGQHFIAITDPGTPMADMAYRLHFRDLFLNDPAVGGRYSALSLFGIVPAALIGMDIHHLLERARQTLDLELNGREGFSALSLGAAMAELARNGRDKTTFIFSPDLAIFGDWLEQLLAESTGKEGTGIVPVVGEPLVSPDLYGDDRVFIAMRWRGDDSRENELQALEAAGHPVIRIEIDDRYDLGAHCVFWELATVIAGHGLGINPFDQPDVEAAKRQCRMMIAEYKRTGRLPEEKPALIVDGIAVYGDDGTLKGILCDFLAQGKPGGYVGLQAYLTQTQETDKALLDLRCRIQEHFRLAVTTGYGPRYLHSTGQLHKGDAGKGLFIQFTADTTHDIVIPNEPGSFASSLSFGTLQAAQAMGDMLALKAAGRPVLRIHFHQDVATSLARLADLLFQF